MSALDLAPQVHGTVAPGFDAVRAELAQVPSDSEAQLAAWVDGELVVDLWTGGVDDGDLIGPVFSCTKGAVHLVVAMLVQDGILDPDERVATYWSAFAAEEKQKITLRQLLTHQAGLVGVPGGFTAMEIADDGAIAERLARQRPWWDPGTAFGYHALTLGALVAQVVRRTTGASLGEVLGDRLPTPPGAVFVLGVPDALESRFRPVLPMLPCADPPPPTPPGVSGLLRGIAFNQLGAEPTDLLEHGNSLAVRRRGPASAGGMANARGMAALYATAVTGVHGGAPVLGDETITGFARHQVRGADVVTGRVDRYALGFEATSLKYGGLLGPRAVGHAGAGGSEAFADPDAGLAYAYTRTRMARSGGGEAPENHRLVRVLVESINRMRDGKDRAP
jgi:CubicO group peptidase (beta-lactamase class C family)